MYGNYNLCGKCGTICGKNNSLCGRCQTEFNIVKEKREKEIQKEIDAFYNLKNYTCAKCQKEFPKNEANTPNSILNKKILPYYCKECWELLTPEERMGEYEIFRNKMIKWADK